MGFSQTYEFCLADKKCQEKNYLFFFFLRITKSMLIRQRVLYNPTMPILKKYIQMKLTFLLIKCTHYGK